MSRFKRATRPISEYVDRLPYLGEVLDEDGDYVDSWGEPENMGVYMFDPGGSAEPLLTGQQRVVTEPTIYLPHGSPFVELDKCVARGKTYQVEGEPARWVHPTDGPKADVVRLKRVTG